MEQQLVFLHTYQHVHNIVDLDAGGVPFLDVVHTLLREDALDGVEVIADEVVVIYLVDGGSEGFLLLLQQIRKVALALQEVQHFGLDLGVGEKFLDGHVGGWQEWR